MNEEAIEKVLLELQNAKAELKTTIKDSETHILAELNTKIKKLEKENTLLREAVENYEIKSKKKNIIVFGINKEIARDVPKLCQNLNQVLETNISERDISDVYLMGRGENCPIKIEFVSFLRKKQLFANLKKLKGSNISISDDLTKKQQEELKSLRKYLKIVREQQPENNSYIRGFKLYINYTGYTAKQLDEGEYIILRRRANSAPATPTVNKDLDEVFEEVEQENNKNEILQTRPQLNENEVKKNIPNEKYVEGKKVYNKKSTNYSVGNQETPKSISHKKPPAVVNKNKTSSSSDSRMMTRSNKN